MLVASELKGELARIQPARACCRRAELAGLLFPGGGGNGLKTLDHATARIVTQLAASLGMATSPVRATSGAAGRRHHLAVALDPALVAGWHWREAPACDRRAFLRGVLLVASISPGPHLELTLRSASAARELRARLREAGVRSGGSRRRGRHVVYVKGQEDVATLLQMAGANRALLDFESSRVARDVRNRLNRLLNAEEANLGRTVRAADRQLRAIAELEAAGRLPELPDGLREAASQRRLQPEADLDTLATALGVSRSAVNHRMRRLVVLAADLRDDEREPVRRAADAAQTHAAHAHAAHAHAARRS